MFNSLGPRQNGRHFVDDTFKRFFQNENVWILIKISLKFVPKSPTSNILSLVQIMAWRRPGAKPLSEPMMVSLLTHICVTRPQWVKPSYMRLRALLLTQMSDTSFYCKPWIKGLNVFRHPVQWQFNLSTFEVMAWMSNYTPHKNIFLSILFWLVG